MADWSAALTSLGPVLTSSPYLLCNSSILLCMLPCHECWIIHSLEKRASRGLGICPNGPPKARKYRKDKIPRKTSTSMGMKGMELPLDGQIRRSMSSMCFSDFLAWLNGRPFQSRSDVIEKPSLRRSSATYHTSPCILLSCASMYQVYFNNDRRARRSSDLAPWPGVQLRGGPAKIAICIFSQLFMTRQRKP